MNKKRYLIMTSIFLSALMVVGCNANQDPNPQDGQNQVDENGNADNIDKMNDHIDDTTEDVDDINGDKENEMPSRIDEDNNAEEDAVPDPEDPVGDLEDLKDENKREN